MLSNWTAALMLDGTQVSGVTIVVADAESVGPNDSETLLPLAQAILARADTENGSNATAWLLDYDLGDTGGFDPFESWLPRLVDAGETGEVVFLFPWLELGAEGQQRAAWAEAAGSELFGVLSKLGLVNLDSPGKSSPLHFIGYGTGAMVVSEAVERLARFDVRVDHLTYLDPHDFKQPGLNSDNQFTLSAALNSEGLGITYGASVW